MGRGTRQAVRKRYASRGDSAAGSISIPSL
jgi:hypothetical protein